MNEYNSVSGLSSSAPLNMNGDRGTDDSDNWVSPGMCYIYIFVRDSLHSCIYDISDCSIKIK